MKSELKDLGVLINHNLQFSYHISGKVDKANQVMGLICTIFTYVDEHNFIL